MDSKRMKFWWFLFGFLLGAFVVAADEKKTQLNFVSLTNCIPDSKIVLYNMTFSTIDGKSYVNCSSRNYIQMTNDLKFVVTTALCSDSVNENVCDYLFEDIEIENVCELLVDSSSDMEIYYGSSKLKNLSCPLEIGDYTFFSGGMVERFMSYIPKEKPYILLYVKCLDGFDILLHYKIYLQVTEVD